MTFPLFFIALVAAGQQPDPEAVEARLRDRTRTFSQCANVALDELASGAGADTDIAQAAMTRCRAQLAEVQAVFYAMTAEAGPGEADGLWEDNLTHIRTSLTRRAAERRARRP